jgi:hypothetical protein
MSQSRAIRSGASAIFRQPLVMLAELAWRWTLSTAVLVLGAYSLLLFLHSLPVTDRDMFGLSGVIPSLFWQTVAHIFSGSGPKMLRIVIVLAIGFTALWWLAASFGRTATLRALVDDSEAAERQKLPLRLRTVFAVNALRVLLGFTAAVAYVAAFLLAFSISGMRAEVGSAVPGAAAKFYLLFVPLAIIIGSIWSLLNWYLALTPVVDAGAALPSPSDTFLPNNALGRFFEAAMLSRRRASQFAWVGFVFGTLRLVLYAAAWFVFLTVAGLLAEVPGGVVLGVLFLLALVYSVISDLLGLVRIAAYLRIVAWDAELLAAPPRPPTPPITESPPTALAETEYLNLPQFPAGPPPEPAG